MTRWSCDTRPGLDFLVPTPGNVGQKCFRFPLDDPDAVPSDDLPLSSGDGVSAPAPSIGPTSSDDVTAR